MAEASSIRVNNSLLIDENGIISKELDFQPSTLLSGCRQLWKLGGFLKRGYSGVHEREWILPEEDLQLSVLHFLKSQSRVSVQKLCHYIKNDLFSRRKSSIGGIRVGSTQLLYVLF